MVEHIQITKSNDKNLIILQSDYRVNGIYFFLKELYPLILEVIFEYTDVDIITIKPEKDAIGYTIGEYKEVKINKEKLLVNVVKNISPDLLLQISCSTEFELGMLAIIKSDEYPLEERVETVHKYFYEDIEESSRNPSHTFCYCESDGYIIYLVNTLLTLNDIKSIATKVDNLSRN